GDVGSAGHSREAARAGQYRGLLQRLPRAERPRGGGPVGEAGAPHNAGGRGDRRRSAGGARRLAGAFGPDVAAGRDAQALMQPLATMPAAARRAARGVLADLDDTITTHGVLTPDAYAALARLRAAGLLVIPITGRPAGWCDHIARMWPVDAVVGENGAFYMRYDAPRRKLVKRFVADARERAANRARLDAIGAKILRAVPGAA